MIKRILAVMLVACVFLSVSPIFSLAAEPVSYLDENGIEQTVSTYTTAKEEDVSWGEAGKSTCVVVDEFLYFYDRLTVYGDLMLILADYGQAVPVKGISVDENATLSIYAQSTGETVGRLVVPNPDSLEDGAAGIGGSLDTVNGAVNIYGGFVEVTGGAGAAGIGAGATSGSNTAESGNITIYGGEVTATGGSNACGIGAGNGNSSVGVITIQNGMVTANGKNGAAGIGAGHGENAGCDGISILGGTVNAANSQYGAGIGGGNGSPCGPIVITGGEISAQGGNYAAGIGSGYNGSTCTGITIEGGRISAKSGNYAAGIGSGYGVGCACGEVKISGAVIDAYGKNATGIGGHQDDKYSVTVTLDSDSAILTGFTADALSDTTITAYNTGRVPYVKIQKAAVKVDEIGYVYLTSAVAVQPTQKIYLLSDNSETVYMDVGESFHLDLGTFTFSGEVVAQTGCRVVESTFGTETVYTVADHALVLQSVKEATCTEDGVSVAFYRCSECGAAFEDEEGENEIYKENLPLYIVPKLGHDFTHYVSDGNATCLEDGTKTAHCYHIGCDATDTVTDEGSKLGHEFTNYISDGNATCLEDGTKTAHCNHIGCDVTDTVADEGSKLGHEFTNYISDGNATCLEDGTKTAHCNHAGCDVTDTIIDEGSKLGHQFTVYESLNDATCTEDGHKIAHCNHAGCDATNTIVDEGSKLGHKFTNYVSDNNATCLEDGTKTAHCDHAGCDATDTVVDEGSKLGHKFTNYVSDNNATCLEDGTKTAHCDHAGCNVTDTIVDTGSKLEHSFTGACKDDENGETHSYLCINGCGEYGNPTPHTDGPVCDECGHVNENPGPEPQETTVDLRIGNREYTNIKGGELLTVESLDVIQDITVLMQNGVDIEGMSEDWSMSTKFLDSEGRSVLEVQLFEQGDDYIVFNLQSHYADCPGADVQDFQIMLIRVQLEESGTYLGDANDDGNIDMKDVLLMRKYLAGLADTVDLANADVNEDKSLDMKDVLMLRKFLAGLIMRLGA